MIIGALRLSFIISADGKSPRSVAQKIKADLSGKFKAAAAELSSGASELVVGVSLVAQTEQQARERLDQIINHFRGGNLAELVNGESEIIHFDDLELERDFEKFNEKYHP